MTANELFDKILAWEHEAGESFPDYFMHDNVKDVSWAFWLLGKGYNERGNEIIAELLAGETCLDQELLYEVISTEGENGKWDVDAYEKNVMLWAEFLTATPYYLKMVTEFFEKN